MAFLNPIEKESMKKTVCLGILLYLISTAVIAQQTCKFGTWSDYQNTSLMRNADASAYLFRSSHARVDADGAPNAYHPDDIGLHCTKGSVFK